MEVGTAKIDEETPKERKRRMRIDYLHQLNTRKDLRKMGYREDGFNRTNDGLTNHERVLKQRAFRDGKVNKGKND